MGRADRWSSACVTVGRELRRSTWSASSSGSTGWTKLVPGSPAELGWDWRLPGAWWSLRVEQFAQTASLMQAATSLSHCPPLNRHHSLGDSAVMVYRPIYRGVMFP